MVKPNIAMTRAFSSADPEKVAQIVLNICADPTGVVVSKDKLVQNAPSILAGLVLGSWFNVLEWSASEPLGRRVEAIATTA